MLKGTSQDHNILMCLYVNNIMYTLYSIQSQYRINVQKSLQLDKSKSISLLAKSQHKNWPGQLT